jgi:hypothetical protein
MGSQDREMKHVEAMGKARSGSGKPQVIEGIDNARPSPSPRDGRVPHNACEAGRAQEASHLAWIKRRPSLQENRVYSSVSKPRNV